MFKNTPAATSNIINETNQAPAESQRVFDNKGNCSQKPPEKDNRETLNDEPMMEEFRVLGTDKAWDYLVELMMEHKMTFALATLTL